MCSKGHGILPFLKDVCISFASGLDSDFAIILTKSLVHKAFILSSKSMALAITSIASNDECAFAPKICLKDLVWNFSNFSRLLSLGRPKLELDFPDVV